MGPNNFNLPTDVAFAPGARVLCERWLWNPRVVKYSKDGKYLLQWGTRGSGPGGIPVTHNVAVERKAGLCERWENRRIEVFDEATEF